MIEQQIEQSFIDKLTGLKYEFRSDITDRAALEQNFREKFEALNRAHLTDAGGCKNNCVRGWFTSDRHPVAVQDDELVESRFPVADGHGPFLGDVA